MSSYQKPLMKEFIWHGRGGRGVWTASILLAKALVKLYQVQSFPTFGPEREGAPLEAFNRISNKKINLHCEIYNPDFVIVLDPTLLTEKRSQEIYSTLKSDGVVIINSPEKIEKPNTYTVDASKIAEKYLGRREMVNIAMLGALKKVLDEKYQFPKIPWKSLKNVINEEFLQKNRPGIAEKNIAAMNEVYKTMEV
jgi:pyruvate ferredoxin oxidoreductase gamma subunit